MKIKGKVAVITGAASGIGHAVCIELANRGVKAIGMVDMNDEVKTVAEQINRDAKTEVAFPYIGDTTNSDFRTQVYNNLIKQHGIVSICVPCAGITRDALAVKVNKETGKSEIYPIEKFRQVVEVNLIAPAYWAMEMIAHIAEDRASKSLKKWHTDETINTRHCYLYRFHFITGEQRPGVLCEHQGRTGRGRRNFNQRSNLPWCTLRSASSRLY